MTPSGRNIATVAVARKLAVIAWHMLSRGEDYAFARPSLVREKIRKLELMTGVERRKGKRNDARRFARSDDAVRHFGLDHHADALRPAPARSLPPGPDGLDGL